MIEKNVHPNTESLADQALRQSEEKYRTIFDNAGDMILIYSEYSKIIVANPLACKKLGYTNLELTSLAAEKINWQGKSTQEQEQIARLMEDGHLSYETVFRHKDGAPVPVEVNARRITWDGQPAMMSICRDISERKTSEAALLTSNMRLRQLALELSTVEERERRRLALYLHDEIAQNLAGLLVKLGILGEKHPSVLIQKEIVLIREELGKTLDQTRSLAFDLSPPTYRNLDLAAALEWTGEILCQKNNLRFILKDDGESKPLGDDVRTLILRCVREIVMNTIKHAEATQVTLTVERSGDLISMTVEDDGCGFEMSRLDWLNPKLGFGLFSVRECLDALDGRCEIDAEPGHGTRVILKVPTQKPSESVNRVSDAESKAGARC